MQIIENSVKNAKKIQHNRNNSTNGEFDGKVNVLKKNIALVAMRHLFANFVHPKFAVQILL